MILSYKAARIAMYAGSLFAVATGLVINSFFSMKGDIHLLAGRTFKLGIVHSDPKAVVGDSGLGLELTLDTLMIHPHESSFEIQVDVMDTLQAGQSGLVGTVQSRTIGSYDLEPLKVRKIEKSDFRFRFVELYPDFTFAYEYPEKRDTIQPKAPGIILELSTPEGDAIVTLGTDPNHKHSLSDIFSLGASLYFFYTISPDSLRVLANHDAKDSMQVIFSGKEQKIYFVSPEKIEERTLHEESYYFIPGQDSTGFTILYSFPDIAYLQAIPTSKGKELFNPVAKVEVWSSGEPAQNAFLYPEAQHRMSGSFNIPGSGYRLRLGVSVKEEVKACECLVTVRDQVSQKSSILRFTTGKSMQFRGFRFTPIACLDTSPQEVLLQVTRTHGNYFLFGGLVLLVITILITLFTKFHTTNHQDIRPML